MTRFLVYAGPGSGHLYPLVARRVTGCGAGTAVLPPDLTAGRLRAAVHEAMSLRPAAQWVGSRLRAAGGPGVAASILERLPAARTA